LILLFAQSNYSFQQEKEVLEFVNSNFVVKLIDAFEDSDNFYFRMEFINGIEFYEMITLLRTDEFAEGIIVDSPSLLNLDRLTPSDIKFYIASIILAIEYLHSHLINHRDLKPENIMINEKVY
jgi:cGMP-dependent protein kinase